LLSCKEISRLVSESLDRELPLGQRLSMRLHLMMCSLCSRFRRQMLFLHRAARAFGAAGEADKLPAQVRLSPEARQRIKQALERESR
jgi:hypothetical protein